MNRQYSGDPAQTSSRGRGAVASLTVPLARAPPALLKVAGSPQAPFELFVGLDLGSVDTLPELTPEEQERLQIPLPDDLVAHHVEELAGVLREIVELLTRCQRGTGEEDS